jgi:hypothetical protein
MAGERGVASYRYSNLYGKYYNDCDITGGA